MKAIALRCDRSLRFDMSFRSPGIAIFSGDQLQDIKNSKTIRARERTLFMNKPPFFLGILVYENDHVKCKKNNFEPLSK